MKPSKRDTLFDDTTSHVLIHYCLECVITIVLNHCSYMVTEFVFQAASKVSNIWLRIYKENMLIPNIPFKNLLRTQAFNFSCLSRKLQMHNKLRRNPSVSSLSTHYKISALKCAIFTAVTESSSFASCSSKGMKKPHI